VVKLGCIPSILAFGNGIYLVTSISETLQGAVYFVPQLYRDLELAFDRYSLHFARMLIHPTIVTQNRALARGFRPKEF
jgi:hypothetical protein